MRLGAHSSAPHTETETFRAFVWCCYATTPARKSTNPRRRHATTNHDEPMNEPGKTYRIELQALPGLTEADAVLGLRAILKTALRCHGLRCTSVTPGPEAEHDELPTEQSTNNSGAQE